MKLKYCFLVTTAFILTFAACTPLSKTVYKETGHNTERYSVVQIPDFKKLDDNWVPYDSATLIPDMLYDRLLTSGNYELVERTSDPVDTEERVLLVNGYVTFFQSGCKFCEWFFLGINDKGKGTTSVWVRLEDKSTGEVISEMSLHGRAEDPGHGQSRYTRIVDGIYSTIENVSER